MDRRMDWEDSRVALVDNKVVWAVNQEVLPRTSRVSEPSIRL